MAESAARGQTGTVIAVTGIVGLGLAHGLGRRDRTTTVRYCPGVQALGEPVGTASLRQPEPSATACRNPTRSTESRIVGVTAGILLRNPGLDPVSPLTTGRNAGRAPAGAGPLLPGPSVLTSMRIPRSTAGGTVVAVTSGTADAVLTLGETRLTITVRDTAGKSAT